MSTSSSTSHTTTSEDISSWDDYDIIFTQTYLEHEIEEIRGEMAAVFEVIVDRVHERTALRADHEFRMRKFAHNRLIIKKYDRLYRLERIPETTQGLKSARREYGELRRRLFAVQKRLGEAKASGCVGQ